MSSSSLLFSILRCLPAQFSSLGYQRDGRTIKTPSFSRSTAERNGRGGRGGPLLSSVVRPSVRPRRSKWTDSRTNYPMPPRNSSESFFGASKQVRRAVSQDVFKAVGGRGVQCPEIRKERRAAPRRAAVASPILIPNNRMSSSSLRPSVPPSLRPSSSARRR